MIKLLHAADLHLDSPLRGLDLYEGAPAERIRTATRRALDNLVELALAEQVALVLLAGDLYDGTWQDYNTGLYFVQQMTRLRAADVPVFLIAGNHDAQNKMTRRLPLPDNVKLLRTDRPESHALDDLGVVIHGQGFATQAVTEDLSERYPAAIPGMFNIGLLHTCAGGAEGHDRYAPCTCEGLARKGYDYWALGHVHTRQTLCERPYIAFPGNTQGRHARETGPKGCLLLTVAGGRLQRAEFQRLDVVRWELCEVDAAGAGSADELADAAAAQLARLAGSEGPNRLLAARILVHGRSALHERLLADPERCAAAVRARAAELGAERVWVEQVKIKTGPLQAPGSHGDGAIEELWAVLADLRSDPSRLRSLADLFQDLRRKLPEELSSGPDALELDDPQWLATTLDAAEAVLRTRLFA
jgi:DNA repair exonuclease SbcCD nuclease subunit